MRIEEIQNFVKLLKQELEKGAEVPKTATIRGVAENSVRPLIREKDENAREKAILSVKKLLDSPKDQENGRFKKSLTEKDIKKIVEVSNIPFSGKDLTNTKKSDHFAPLFPARIGQDLPYMPVPESRNKARRLPFGANKTRISCFYRFFLICPIYRCFLVSRQKITPTTNRKLNQTPILK